MAGGGLHICGCRWRVASDDFVIPSWFEFFFRLAGLVIVVAVFIYEELNGNTCAKEHHLNTYLIVAIVIFIMTIINNFLLARHSMRGIIWTSRSREDPRSFVPALIYMNIITTILEFAWVIVGLVWVIRGLLQSCASKATTGVDAPIIVIMIVIILTAIGLTLKVILSCLAFTPSQKKADSGNERGCGSNCLRFCTKRSRINVFEEVGNVLDYVFHDPDFVPTDIASALLLLYAHTSPEDPPPASPVSQTEDDIQIVVEPNRQVPDDDSEWFTLESVAHFMDYAGASYGYAWFLMRNTGLHMCQVYQKLQCCACCSCFHEQGFIEGDNCLNCNTAALKAMLPHLDSESIVHISFKNGLLETPYFVALDHKYKKIVISIRGTLSLKDAITDLCAIPRSINEFDEDLKLPEELMAHAGMIGAAKYVFDELQCNQRNILNKALSYYDDYQIVVTGHSLGAGTAVVLAFMLRQIHPSTKCYAFSPPGQLLNGPAAEASEEFVVSAIVGDDLVPRLSIPNLDLFTSRMKYVLHRCKMPKYKILANGVFSCLGAKNELEDEIVRIFTRRRPSDNGSSSGDSNEPIISPVHAPRNYEAVPPDDVEVIERSSRRKGTTSSLSASIPLKLPGKILHYTPTPDGMSFNVTRKKAEDFEEIRVSPRMLRDHLPNNVTDVIRAASGQIREQVL